MQITLVHLLSPRKLINFVYFTICLAVSDNHGETYMSVQEAMRSRTPCYTELVTIFVFQPTKQIIAITRLMLCLF